MSKRRKRIVVGAAVVLAAGMVVLSGSTDQATGAPGATGQDAAAGLVSHLISGEGQTPTLVLIEPQAKQVGVYHINPATGELKLKSVRNVTWDLQMIDYNSGDPAPADIGDALPR